MDITKLNQDAVVKVLADYLDTRDKRYMFLKCRFPQATPIISLEGSAKGCAINMYRWFDNNNMVGSLMACLNTTFDTDLYLA